MKFCYKRVSTNDQNTDRQLNGLIFDREFVEKVSAKDIHRPELISLLSILRKNDEVHVHELSRLARNTKDLLKIVDQVIDAGASIQFHKENLSFSSNEDRSPVQDLMLNLLGAIAQFERNLLLERQREGISLAKQRGVYKGRQSRFTENDLERMRSEFKLAKKPI